ncbi:MAG: hypothetical protein ABI925_01345 [Verrucomicrobiota bacterium]
MNPRFLCVSIIICLFAAPRVFAAEEAISLSEAQEKFRAELAAKSLAAEKENAGAIAGADGWLFLSSDIRFLSIGRFWGEEAAKISRARKMEAADPIPAIVDFHEQLKQRGIELVVLSVPSKAAVYPETLVSDVDLKGQNPAPFLERFYRELGGRGIDVVDLTSVFLQNRGNEHGPVFCKTDSHWSGLGCVLAAQAIATRLRAKFASQPSKNYAAEWKDAEIKGDLVELLGHNAKKPGPETVAVRMVSEKESGAPVNPDPNSPLLIMGDSHTLVYHDFHAERAGLVDQLANELGFAPDLIGTRGSGATAVRISLYRRSHKDTEYLSKKKVIVWCFAAREFTESDQGWEKIPVAQ